MTANDKVYREIGKKIDELILNRAKNYIDENGESEKVVFQQTVELEAYDADGCIEVKVKDNNGNTITYHREI